MPQPRRGPILHVLALGIAGLLHVAPSAGQDTTRHGAPTQLELRTATYHGFDARDTVTLTDGRWQGPPYVEGGATRPMITLAPDFRLTGDLDGDGHDDAVVVMTESSGGSGTWVYLAMMGRREGQVVNLATHQLGDRVQIRDARIEHAVLYVEVLRAGPEDAACCPGELASLAWKLLDGRFAALSDTGATGRFGPGSLAGVEWVLHRWSADERVTVEQPPTLRVQLSRVSGNAGCNSYGTSLAQDGQPGEMRFGTFTLTRMMCEPPAMEVEARFLESLGQAVRLWFLGGRLAITYRRTDGTLDTLLFERHPLPQ